MKDPKAQWIECDSDGSGFVTFDEFCDWAIKKNMVIEYSSHSKNELKT